MKRKQIGVLGLAVVIVIAVGVIGSTIAEPTSKTQNKVSAGDLEMQVYVNGEEGGEVTVQEPIVPGQTVKKEVKVKNTGSDQDMYVQVAVNKAWLTAQGEPETDQAIDPNQITLKLTEGSGWKLLDDSDPEMVYYYYTRPVRPGEETEALMTGYSVLEAQREENSNHYANKQVSLGFTVDAVQALGAENAILAEWGLEAQIADDGTLTLSE